MSYQVLARKYRPASFQDLEGQEHVLQALVNALDNQRLHHAYLFTGTRGVGKTTIARILARCLNCETGVTSKPCGECSSCREISEGRSVDLIEVDAASRTGVDDMRELLSNVQYMPSSSRFKIYLIDEVHMLSGSSFNAMLKTLEEPPEHVKFLFATTDPKKLPITVLSRCLQFNLKNLSPEQIVRYLGVVLEKESIASDDAALWQLGHAADGSMRDALSLTDQAISFGNGEVRDASVKAMLGSIDHQEVYDLLDAVLTSDGERMLAKVASLAEFSPDYAGLLDNLLSILHRVAIAHAAPAALDNAEGDKALVEAAAAKASPDQVQLMYQIGLIGQRDLPLAPMPRVGFEMVLLRMLSFVPETLGGGRQTSSHQDPGDQSTGNQNSDNQGSGHQRPDVNNSGGQNSSSRAVASDGNSAIRNSTAASGEQDSGKPGSVPARPAPETQQKTGSPAAAILSVIRESPKKTRAPVAQVSVVPPSQKESIVENRQATRLGDALLQNAKAEKQGAISGGGVDKNLPPHVSNALVKDDKRTTTHAPSLVNEAQTENVRAIVANLDSPANAHGESDGSKSNSGESGRSNVLASKDVPEFEAANWPAIIGALGLSGVTQTLAANCQLDSTKDDRCMLRLGEHHASMWNKSHEARISDALSTLFGRPIRVAIEVGETSVETPAQLQTRERKESLAAAVMNIEGDANVQQLIKGFNGRLDPNSISALIGTGE